MTGNSILEVAIGMIFIFALLAILVTQINSLISNLLNLRGKDLKKGIQDLITDNQIQAKVLAHPIIKMVNVAVPPDAQIPKEMVKTIKDKEAERVTYITPTAFVEALLNILILDSDSEMFGPLQNAINGLPSSPEKSQLREMLQSMREEFTEGAVRKMHMTVYQLENITPEQRQALYDAIRNVEANIGQIRFNNEQLIPLMNGIRRVKDPRFRAALESVVITAKDVGEARQKLEAWFNDGMSRVSQWYKERMQFISVVVAGILCFLFNVDALQLGRTLWEDPLLRAQIVQQASTFDQSRFVPAPTPPPDVNSTPMPEPTPAPEGEATTSREVTIIDPNTGEVMVIPADQSYLAQDTITAIVQAQQQAKESLQVLLDLQLPLGWEWQVVTDSMVQTSLQAGLSDPRTNPRNLWNFTQINGNWFGLLVQKIVGILASTIAAAQGAPFWFDLLNRLRKNA
ncbi:MAG: hypothetical protein CUN52_07455 [Phototrophicales bacterium]|nr:MAG: hypothetical protein CUN52_07455 [Phototrophicales bacterium]